MNYHDDDFEQWNIVLGILIYLYLNHLRVCKVREDVCRNHFNDSFLQIAVAGEDEKPNLYIYKSSNGEQVAAYIQKKQSEWYDEI